MIYSFLANTGYKLCLSSELLQAESPQLRAERFILHAQWPPSMRVRVIKAHARLQWEKKRIVLNTNSRYLFVIMCRVGQTPKAQHLCVCAGHASMLCLFTPRTRGPAYSRVLFVHFSLQQTSSASTFFSSIKKIPWLYLGGILETIGQTPVVKIQNLLPQADADRGVKIYAKCEFFNPLSSVKDRLALGIITGTVLLRCLSIPLHSNLKISLAPLALALAPHVLPSFLPSAFAPSSRMLT